MPPLPPVLLTLKFQLRGTWAGKPWANVFHAKYHGGPPSAVNCADMAAQMATSYHDTLMTLMSSTVALVDTVCTDLSTSSSASADPATPHNGGTGFATTVPNSVAFGIDWHAARRYRGGHAKTFLPGFDQTRLFSSVQWTDFAVSTVQTGLTTFLTDVAAINSGTTIVDGLVVVHYFQHRLPLVPPQVEDITSGTAKSFIYSQRGRRS